MLSEIRYRIGKFYLKKAHKGDGRKREIKNLSLVRTVGILYILNSVSDYEAIEQIVTSLQHEGKEVRAMGFVKDRKLITRFLPRLSYDFFCRRDITWFYKPVHERARDFIRRDFDLLIDLSLEECIPLNYIASNSAALCRVGRLSKDQTIHYDVLIDSRPSFTVSDFYLQIRHYLSLINLP